MEQKHRHIDIHTDPCIELRYAQRIMFMHDSVIFVITKLNLNKLSYSHLTTIVTQHFNFLLLNLGVIGYVASGPGVNDPLHSDAAVGGLIGGGPAGHQPSPGSAPAR